jgi:hypothetical protein
MNIDNWLQTERLKTAWALLPADKKAAIQPMIDAAHDELGPIKPLARRRLTTLPFLTR